MRPKDITKPLRDDYANPENVRPSDLNGLIFIT